MKTNLLLGMVTLTILHTANVRADYEADFQARATTLINQVADSYAPPSSSISDAGKYYWPKVIARLKKYPGDSWANTQITNFRDRDTFHFWFPGMARIMCGYSSQSAMVASKQNYLNKIWSRRDGYNIWTGEGTENHIMMSRPNGYLYAWQSLNNSSFPNAATRKSEMKTWINNEAKKIYSTGLGEWDSSTYLVYTAINWLNVYDFAPDTDAKSSARAVLDYISSAIALKYTQGVLSGASMRGATITSTSSGTEYLGWLWFGDNSKTTPTWSGNEYIQSVHAAVSTYRPPAIAVKLATKALTKNTEYRNSKPSYLLDIASHTREIFFVGPNYTLGSTFCPYGGWTGGDNQIQNWKLVARATSGASTAHAVTGNGGWRSGWRGQGRNPWDQFVQSKNVLIQMSLVPSNASTIDSQINSVINTWRTEWQSDFSARFPGDTKPNPVNKASGNNSANTSYISYPQSAATTTSSNVRFLDLNGTYLAIRSLSQTAPSTPGTAESGRNYVRDSAAVGTLCGLVMEVGNSTNHGTFSNFQTLIVNKNGLDKSQLSSRIVKYTALDNTVISATYQTSGSFSESLYDWGYGPTTPQINQTSPPFIQPSWPSGTGHAKLASWSVNGSPVSLTTAWPVYQGSNLTMTGSVMTLIDGTSSYKVNFSGTTPVFTTTP